LRRLVDLRLKGEGEICWHVYYGDVHVGTIAIRVGVPHHEDPCGDAREAVKALIVANAFLESELENLRGCAGLCARKNCCREHC
jgi:hypothetical protein